MKHPAWNLPVNLGNPRVIADFAQMAIDFRLLHPTKVIVWIDGLIAEVNVPPEWMIKLSMVDLSNPHDMQVPLRQVPGDPNPRDSIGLLNGLILREWRNGRLSIGNVRHIGWAMWDSHGDHLELLTKWGVVVYCTGEEADQRFITQREFRDTIDQQLVPFEPYVAQLPSWA